MHIYKYSLHLWCISVSWKRQVVTRVFLQLNGYFVSCESFYILALANPFLKVDKLEMDSEFPEQFKCPICFEIHEKEIYQCENGHIICDKCVNGLSLCPQCRVNLNTKGVRNRALEDLLDMLKFNCTFKSEGCIARVTRKEMSTHHDDCTFG